MARYRLKLKDSVTLDESEKEKYNVTQSSTKGKYLLFGFNGYGMCLYGSTSYDSDLSKLTEHEIDLIPNGLFKKFDVIEIEEDKYNIICPLTSCYLVIDKDNNKTRWINTDHCEDNDLFKNSSHNQKSKVNLSVMPMKRLWLKIIQNK